MALRRRVAVRATLVGLVLAVVASVTACSGGSRHHEPCRTVCTGSIDGANYAIRVPARWNGTLLVYSHGYVAVGKHPVPALTQQDAAGRGTDPVSAALLAKGYALAASAYHSNGWAVAEALDDDNRLYRRFVDTVGAPKRTLVWGSSMGGLITELLAERAPWVDGALALCGVVAGPLDNADNLQQRALVLAARLTGVDLTPTGRLTAAQIHAVLASATTALGRVVADRTGGAAEVLAVSILLGLPEVSSSHGVGTFAERVDAAAQNLGQYLSLALPVANDLTQRFGSGFASPRLGTATFAPSPLLAAGLRALGGDPAAIRTAFRTTPAPGTSAPARARVAASGDPTGNLRVPLLTVHDEDDPIAIVANESALHQRVAAAGESSRLRQVSVPPALGSTPDFVGHCVFTAQQQTGAIAALDAWTRSGVAPSGASVTRDLGAGVDPAYTPPPWPVP